VTRLPDSTGFSELLELEQKIRAVVFQLINSPYIELIFRINANFACRHFSNAPSASDNTPEHLAFVASWRKTKIKDLEAIQMGIKKSPPCWHSGHATCSIAVCGDEPKIVTHLRAAGHQTRLPLRFSSTSNFRRRSSRVASFSMEVSARTSLRHFLPTSRPRY